MHLRRIVGTGAISGIGITRFNCIFNSIWKQMLSSQSIFKENILIVLSTKNIFLIFNSKTLKYSNSL